MSRFALALVCLPAALCLQASYAQVRSTSTTASVQVANTSTTPVAYVYVSTSKGTSLYNAASNAYVSTPTSPANTITPGIGYWAKFPTVLSVGQGTAPTSTVTVTLQQGWNQIGQRLTGSCPGFDDQLAVLRKRVLDGGK